MVKLTKIRLHIHILEFGGQHSGYHIVETMNIIGVDLISFAPNLITRVKYLVWKLKIQIKREPKDATQKGINFHQQAWSLSGMYVALVVKWSARPWPWNQSWTMAAQVV